MLVYKQGKSVVEVITRGRQRSQKKNAKRGRKLSATAIALIMLSAQMVTAAHFLLIPHTIDRRTGKTIRLIPSHDTRDCPEETDHGSDDDQPADHSSHDDECPIVMLLHQAKLPVTAACTVISDALLSAELTVLSPEPLVEAHRRIYLVSPSHSPPAV